jgi:hypothetical protein
VPILGSSADIVTLYRGSAFMSSVGRSFYHQKEMTELAVLLTIFRWVEYNGVLYALFITHFAG